MSALDQIDRRTFVAATLLAASRVGRSAEESRRTGDGEPLRLSEYVARQQGPTSGDASQALIAALRQASVEERPLLVDGRFTIRHNLPVPGPVKIFGRAGQNDGFNLVAPPASIGGGIHGHLMLDAGRSIDGVSFEELTFRGGFDSQTYAGARNVPMVRIAPHSGMAHRNITFLRCKFVDPVTDCVHSSPDLGGRVENLSVVECEANVTVPLSRASRSANLLRTILAHQDWAGHKESYGKIANQGVKVQRCKARGIRTLADLKRGTANFEVSDCETEDMSACHHSADGSFHGVFTRLKGIQRDPILRAANFVEVQGEDIEITHFTYLSSSRLGAFASIMITPYAFPVEGNGAYHQSKRIRIEHGRIEGIDQHAAVRIINATDCQVRNIVVDDATGAAVSVENPAGGLTPSNIMIEDIKTGRSRVSAGVFIAPTARSVQVRRVTGFDRVTTGGGHAEP